MVERFGHYLIFGLLLSLVGAPAFAGSPGQMEMLIRDRKNRLSQTTMSVGDTLTVQMWVKRGAETSGIIQTDLYASFDDRFLQLVPESVTGQGAGGGQLRPFKQGSYLNGTIQTNDTQGDAIGNSSLNKISLFQLAYSEVIPRSPNGSQRSVRADSAEVATFRVRALRKPPETGATLIRMDTKNPGGGSETGYNIDGDPGNIRNFRQFTGLSVTIIGLQLVLDLPVLRLLPGVIDSTVDLDDHVDDPVNPDSTIVWSLGAPVPDSIAVSLSGSHKVVVDPRFPVAGADSANFIGIVKVPVTATTLLNDVLTDTLLIIVDTPPAFDIPAMRAAIPIPPAQDAADSTLVTVQFAEDTPDSSLVLIGTDADPGALLRFASLDASDNIFSAVTDSGGRVTLTTKKDFFGEEIRRFVLTDQYDLADTVRVRIVVTPVNDPPEYIKAYPNITVGVEGQATLLMAEYVTDVDDLFEDLRFTFTGADSIAFDVTTGNERLTITAVPPFMGSRDVDVVVTDTSTAAAVQRMSITVQPPPEPQAPQYLREFLKIGVRAGDNPTVVSLDTLVSDLDTPKNRIVHTHGAVQLVTIDSVALATNRRLRGSAAPTSLGYEATTLTATDPQGLFGTMPVRIYSASPVTGVPVAGGLPDLTMVAGATDTLDLDDYYFDANNTDSEMTWEAIGDDIVAADIVESTHQAIFRAPSVADQPFDEIVFVVRDPTGLTSTDTVLVTVLNPGSVFLDLKLIGLNRTVFLEKPDTLDLRKAVVAGDLTKIEWTAQSQNSGVLFSQILPGHRLLMIGIQQGNSQVTITARDTASGNEDTGTLNVAVRASSSGNDQLRLAAIGPLTLKSGRDTTLDLKTYIEIGNAADLVWSELASNPNVAVEIDSSAQLVTLRPRTGFIGPAGAISFRARDVFLGIEAFTTATPVTVVQGGSVDDIAGLLEISLVVNPVLESFLDVFVISRRALESDPFLTARVGEASQPRPIVVDSVARVSGMWVGDLFLTRTDTGLVELVAQGRTAQSLVTLRDTLQFRVDEAGNRTRTSLSLKGVTVDLPANALKKPTAVALFPTRDISAGESSQAGGGAVPPNQGLIPVSGVFQIHAPEASLEEPGRIRFEGPLSGTPGVGLYVWLPGSGVWKYVASEVSDGGISGNVTRFGRYGLFADRTVPAVGGYDAVVDPPGLAFDLVETGSGISEATLAINGFTVEATLEADEGRLVWTPTTALPGGSQVLRIELHDRTGNIGTWEETVDLARVIPLATTPVLHPNYPNPFNPSTHLAFDLPASDYVRLTIYNVLGQEVIRLLDGTEEAGRHSIRWDARDAGGREVAGGLFLYRLETGSAALTRKMMFLK